MTDTPQLIEVLQSDIKPNQYYLIQYKNWKGEVTYNTNGVYNIKYLNKMLYGRDYEEGGHKDRTQFKFWEIKGATFN
jgi:hypothetical protein